MTLRYLAPFISALLLAACASTPPQPPTSAPAPAQPPSQTSAAPSIIIDGRTPQVILDEIVAYRTQKGMQVLSRADKRVEFKQVVPRAKTPTEARIRYELTPTGKSWKLSARVFQVSYPGTTRESVSDITAQVADKLTEELPRYAHGSASW